MVVAALCSTGILSVPVGLVVIDSCGVWCFRWCWICWNWRGYHRDESAVL